MKHVLTILMTLFFSMQLQGFDYEKAVVGLEAEAVVIGEGETRIYAFLDPLCAKSQNYLGVISESERLQKMNTYYIFLYRMEKYRSDALIEYIYDAGDVAAMMYRVMVDGYRPKLGYFAPSEAAVKRKSKISDVAERFHAKGRPYLLLFKAGSKYCKVSEGTAPCLEDARKD